MQYHQQTQPEQQQRIPPPKPRRTPPAATIAAQKPQPSPARRGSAAAAGPAAAASAAPGPPRSYPTHPRPHHPAPALPPALPPADDSLIFEIDPSELLLGQILGRGSFGEVRIARWQGTTVAVKSLFDSSPKARKNPRGKFRNSVTPPAERINHIGC